MREIEEEEWEKFDLNGHVSFQVVVDVARKRRSEIQVFFISFFLFFFIFFLFLFLFFIFQGKIRNQSIVNNLKNRGSEERIKNSRMK